MKMKQLLSIALLVSAFAASSAFADGWVDTVTAPFKFGYDELGGLFQNVKGMTWGNQDAADQAIPRLDVIKGLKLYWYGAASILALRYIYDNLDDIKAALGLGADQSEADAGQIFASACGCEDAQDEEENKEEVAVCALEEKVDASEVVS